MNSAVEPWSQIEINFGKNKKENQLTEEMLMKQQLGNEKTVV